MAYRFRKRESVTSAIRRLIREETDKAINSLESVPKGRVKGIHEARKSIKKMRAVLRLVQPRLGDHFAAANRAYRDISRQLSGPRDAEAMIECLDKLAGSMGQSEHDDLFGRIRSILVERRDEVIKQSEELKGKVQGLAQMLAEVKAASEQWVIHPNGFGALRDGVKRAYARGRKAMKTAFDASSDMHFHEWRKEVKAHWYHIRLLRGIWPKVMIALENELSTLADLLGDDHDLAVLRDTLAGELAERLGESDLRPLLAVIRKRRQQLRRTAHSLAQHLYVEKPGDLRERFQRYWVIWHKEAKGVEEYQVNGPGDQAEIPMAAPEPTAAAPGEAETLPVSTSESAAESTLTDPVDDSSDTADVVGSIHVMATNPPRPAGRVV